MKIIAAVLFVLLVLLQYRLWVHEGGMREVWHLRAEVAVQKEENDKLVSRNRTLVAEVQDLKKGKVAVEERARTDLGSWMHRRCGLVSESNSCRCHKKTKSYVAAGLVDPTRLLFNADYTQRIREVVIRNAGVVMDEVDDLDLRVFRDHPLQISKTRVLDEVLGNATLRGFFGLDGEGASPAPGDDGRALDTPRSVD